MAQDTAKKEPKEKHALPEGRVINHSMFVLDVFKDPETGKEGKPRYNVEIAFDPAQVEGEGTIEDALLDACIDEWGPEAEDWYFDGTIRTPFIDGDALAKDREERGKVGDAYKGKKVARIATLYNRNGVESGAGGIAVYDEEVNLIEPVNASGVFNGCYGVAGVTIVTGKDPGTGKRGQEPQRYVKFFLQAFQVTKRDEDDRLSTGADHSSLFKPVGRKEGEGTSRRRSRKG